MSTVATKAIARDAALRIPDLNASACEERPNRHFDPEIREHENLIGDGTEGNIGDFAKVAGCRGDRGFPSRLSGVVDAYVVVIGKEDAAGGLGAKPVFFILGGAVGGGDGARPSDVFAS